MQLRKPLKQYNVACFAMPFYILCMTIKMSFTSAYWKGTDCSDFFFHFWKLQSFQIVIDYFFMGGRFLSCHSHIHLFLFSQFKNFLYFRLTVSLKQHLSNIKSNWVILYLLGLSKRGSEFTSSDQSWLFISIKYHHIFYSYVMNWYLLYFTVETAYWLYWSILHMPLNDLQAWDKCWARIQLCGQDI